MSILKINSKVKNYQIHISRGLLSKSPLSLIRNFCGEGKIILITDENVECFYANSIIKDLKAVVFKVKAKESFKTLFTYTNLCRDILNEGVDLNSIIISLGGGMVGDISGFLASTLLRGIKLVHIPTTLLSQVDSSIGGKNGVNAFEGKNLIGSIYNPDLILIDPDVLKTLPIEQLKSGYAEMLKYALINDAEFFSFLESQGLELLEGNYSILEKAIIECCKHKTNIIREDEFKKGCRDLLNLGHTFGHAIEKESDYKIAHGYAVSVGICISFLLSVELGLCPVEDFKKTTSHLKKMGLPTDLLFSEHIKNVSSDALINRIKYDKKNTYNQINLILVRGIGKAFIARDVQEADIRVCP